MPTTALIFDIAILAILLIFTLRGASRGLLLSLCSLVAVIVAFIGASFAADALSPKVTEYLEPKFASAIEQRLEERLKTDIGSAGDQLDGLGTQGDAYQQGLIQVLKDMGLYQIAADAIDEAVESGIADVAAETAAAAAASIAGTVAYMLIFFVSFIIVLVLWTALSHALDLVTRLPGLNTLNKTGGALLGLLKGAVLLFLCAWAVNTFWPVIPKETVEKTYLLNFFLNTNPVALVLSALPTAKP